MPVVYYSTTGITTGIENTIYTLCGIVVWYSCGTCELCGIPVVHDSTTGITTGIENTIHTL